MELGNCGAGSIYSGRVGRQSPDARGKTSIGEGNATEKDSDASSDYVTDDVESHLAFGHG